MTDAPPPPSQAEKLSPHQINEATEDDEFADLFGDLEIKEKREDAENEQLQQLYKRHYVAWDVPEKSCFDKEQTDRASALMKKTIERMGSKGFDFDRPIKKWFFTKKMWEAQSTKQYMEKYGWEAYQLTEKDKKDLKSALLTGKIRNLDVK